MNCVGPNGRDSGMTLVELLVVVFIISILAGMLMPVHRRVVQQAQTDICVSNMRQVLLGLQMYMADWDEIPADHVGEEPHYIRWCLAVLPYVGDKRVFLCPADPDNGEFPPRRRCGVPCGWDYTYNRFAIKMRGGEGRRVHPDSPVLVCSNHVATKDIYVIGRKDTSVEVAPTAKYAGGIHVVFE